MGQDGVKKNLEHCRIVNKYICNFVIQLINKAQHRNTLFFLVHLWANGESLDCPQIKSIFKHTPLVKNPLEWIQCELLKRTIIHDESKFHPPEREGFDNAPDLKKISYGTPEYEESKRFLKVALDHHYSVNDHHPEHFEDGVNGMSLSAFIEMFLDWAAAIEKHSDGNIYVSIKRNKVRFKMTDTVETIFVNTAKAIGLKGEDEA